jgi:hypothetical protein
MRVFLLTFLALVLTACSSPSSNLNHQGDAKVWSPHLFQFTGPKVSESREAFLDYSLDIEFTHEDGHSIWVIGYLSVVNDGAPSKWAAKFVPDAAGEWTYEYVFRHAPNIALNIQALNHGHGLKESGSGSFKVGRTTLDPNASDFRKKGMLQDVGARYLQFSGTKDYFLKTGAGSPENILAYADFDGTYDVGGTNFPALGENQLHEFEPHLKDVRDGDPTWGEGKGAAILGIANYYEEVGVNAQYLVTMNVEGDGQEVFPWVSHNDPYVFDVSKLAQWQTVFEHFNARGVLIDMLLAETENESWFEAFDGDQVGRDFADSRKLYYREMVARFGHLNGLVLNLGEEHGVVGNSGKDPYRQPTSVEQRRAFAKYIRDLDPYDHAVVSHNWPDSEEENYGPLLGEPDYSGMSLQVHHHYFDKVSDWTQRSEKAGRPWMVTVDEPLGWEFGARPDGMDPTRRREIEGVLWPVLMGGGAGVDWYFGWQNNAPTSDLSNEDQRTRHELWVTSAKVRRFIEKTFQLETMVSDRSEDGLKISWSGKDKSENPVSLVMTRSQPELPKEEGHHPWEYRLEGLVLKQGDILRDIDPLNPQ